LHFAPLLFSHGLGEQQEVAAEMMRLSLEWIYDPKLLAEMKITPLEHFSDFEIIAAQGLHDMIARETNITAPSSPQSKRGAAGPFASRDIFWSLHHVNHCLRYAYYRDSFITKDCAAAIHELSLAVNGVDLLAKCQKMAPGVSGILMSTTFFVGFLITFCGLFKDKERFKRVVDQRRWTLQASLDDPVVRASMMLRNKPEHTHEAFLERRYYERLANWDYKTLALNQLRRKMRGFRHEGIRFSLVCLFWGL
jgi:hypothetical protein